MIGISRRLPIALSILKGVYEPTPIFFRLTNLLAIFQVI